MLFDIEILTSAHTAISLIALTLGIFSVVGLFVDTVPRIWTTLFLILAVTTTVSGFFFPLVTITPAFITGIVSSLVLLVVLAARYIGHYAGHWRWIYAAGVVASLYLLVFVTIAQVFTKTPVLQTGVTFAITQLVTLVIFVILGLAAAKKFQR